MEQAEALVHSREELLSRGLTDRQLRALVADGKVRRLHRGYFTMASDWEDLWPEGRHALEIVAVRRASPGDGPVFTHYSAAVLWGLPLYRVLAPLVHVLIRGSRHTRTEAGVVRHDLDVLDADIVERHGMLCTSLNRTVFDVLRVSTPEAAVSAADAALRAVAVRRNEQDASLAEDWRGEVSRLARSGFRGVRQVRWVAEFADGRAQLPGESVSRLQLFRLGFQAPDLQVPVVGSEGDQYFLDFGFRRSRMFGEFDGEGKYLEPDLRSAPTAADAVLAEKRREDDIRGVTGWGIRRWGSAHIATPAALGRRLSAFGIHPPG